MSHADQKYIDALLSDDKELVREIYERFSNKIKRMVLQQGGTETDARDIFQDALLSIYNRATKGGFILTCPFEGFLHVVCKRKWVKEVKKINRLTLVIGNEDNSIIDDTISNLADECMIHEARKALIVQNIARLGEKCKQLLYLSWEDKTMEEVSALLNITYGYARKKKSECMKKLVDLIHQSPDYNSLTW